MSSRNPQRRTGTGVSEESFPHTRPHALVVDDDAAIRVLLTRILTRRGFIVDAAHDGAEAIEHIAHAEYAVIILDLMMPRVDGVGVIRYLNEYHPAMLQKVIVISAFGASAREQVCPPVVRFVEKPFDVDTLLAQASECADES